MRCMARSRKGLAAAAMAIGFVPLVALTRGGTAATAADADVMVFAATASSAAATGLLSTSATYTFDPSQTCFSEPLPTTPPSPLPASIPGFLDIPPDESGPCTAVTGSSSLSTLVACSTGVISIDWQLTEPLGDTAHVVAGGVLVAGIVVAATLPGGYTDDSSTIDEAAVLGVLLPQLPNNNCVAGVRQVQVSAVVAAVY